MPKPSKFYQRLVFLTLYPACLPVDKALVRLTGYSLVNRIYAKAGGMRERPCLLMTTLHWKTGAPKTVVLPYHQFDHQYVVQGSLAGRPQDPVWATNVRAYPFTWLKLMGLGSSAALTSHKAMNESASGKRSRRTARMLDTRRRPTRGSCRWSSIRR